MERMITVGKKPYKIRASAAVPLIYKAQFGTDYNEDIAELQEGDDQSAYIIGCRLLWAMARTVKEKLPTPDEWIVSFKPKELKQALTVSRKLFELSLGSDDDDEGGGDGEPFTAERFMALAARCGLSFQDLKHLPLGMAIKTISEYASLSSEEEYVSGAEFFGE